MPTLQCHTSQPTVLAVTDEDAASYLQSQFSNDLRRSESNPVTYGLFLDRKGKVQHDAFILQRGPEDFLLISYHSDAETLQHKVEENIIADEVVIEDVSAQFRLITLWGDDDALAKISPAKNCFSQVDGALIFHSRMGGVGSLDCLIPSDIDWCPTGFSATESTADALRASRIDAGFPAIPQDIGSSDLPHEGGDLSKIAVSYTKGCYLGQEVMARLHSMGQAQRAIYRVSFASQSETGLLPVFSGERQVGSITSHVDGVGLALLKRRYVNNDAQLCIAKQDGAPVKIISEITA
ncbi:YgfZ/GcvT domain-containing protein [Cerasicoccus fimbriatus]|uniref:CAF17-like 4Fe-4S cluster assembly/insertion protein YgfZ n=1 Tax=Cerasicoccus fimbriatus TaxID=3014554 RepID=UPI0022B33BB6|nr:hypothetical protein [Cerasicoccus sp. TK19100]